MAYDFQVVVDSADPHVLAGWWAETLGWTVEPSNEEFIREMVAKGYAKEEDTRTFNGVLVWKEGAAILHPDTPADSPPRRVLFQLVPEAKSVKNRLHFDIRVGEANHEATMETLTARGAKVLWRGKQGPRSWITMADPEGNEFCVA